MLKRMILLVLCFAGLTYSTVDNENENGISAKRVDGSLPNQKDVLSTLNSVDSLNSIMSNLEDFDTTLIVKDSVVEKKEKVGKTWSGQCTYYNYGKKTANGRVFKPYTEATCASSASIPFNTKLRVTNLKNNKSVIVTVTDRGAFSAKHPNNLDLSICAFKQIASTKAGRVSVRIEVLK